MRKLGRAVLGGLLRWPWLVPVVAIVVIAVLGQYGPAWVLTNGAIWLAAIALIGGVVLAASHTPRPPAVEDRAAEVSGTPTKESNAASERESTLRTDLRGAILTNARMAGADLREADLRGADLRGADLSGANLERALLGPPADKD